MRVLLDECLPRRLRTQLAGHEVQTVQGMGWSGKKNGELLAMAAEAAFEVLITADQNMPYQQNLRNDWPAVVTLIAPSNRLQDLIPLVPATLTALESIRPGQSVAVTPEIQQDLEEK